MEGCQKSLWLLLILWVISFGNAEQMRISSYTTEVSQKAIDDTTQSDDINAIGIEAIVREIKLVPFLLAGYTPARAFVLPSDLADNESVTEESVITSTVADELEVTTAETTASYPIAATRGINEMAQAPYPAAGYRPKIPFDLPPGNLLKNEKNEEAAIATPLAEFTTPANVEMHTPYPPAGYKPSIVFFLPNADLFPEPSVPFQTESQALENDFKVESTTQVSTDVVTTVDPLETTIESETKTPLAEFTTPAAVDLESKAPYPPAGFKPKILFLLPTESELNPDASAKTLQLDPNAMSSVKNVKAPYPAAGYRPSKAFLLPNEQLKLAEGEKESTQMDNSNNPACGSSTDPLAPKPVDGEKTDPESETIFPSPQTVKVPARLTRRPFTYTTHLHAW